MNIDTLVRLIRYLVRLVGVLLVVSMLSFFGLSLIPGDPARAILGESGTPEAVALLHQQLGLDQPIIVRYFGWLGGVISGNFGKSYSTSQPVVQMIAERTPATLEVIFLSQIIALLVAIPIAMIAAVKRNSGFDRLAASVASLLLSAPQFVLGYVLIYVFAIFIHALPANGYVPIGQSVSGHFQFLVLPCLTLAAAPIALYIRVLRADAVATYEQDFMAVARAKGLSPGYVAVRHGLRPSLIGLSTSVGVTVGTLIGADVVVEVIFGIPGIGAELAHAVGAREYVEVQGLVLVITAAFVVINAVTDLVQLIIDPRLRVARTGLARTGAKQVTV